MIGIAENRSCWHSLPTAVKINQGVIIAIETMSTEFTAKYGIYDHLSSSDLVQDARDNGLTEA